MFISTCCLLAFQSAADHGTTAAAVHGLHQQAVEHLVMQAVHCGACGSSSVGTNGSHAVYLCMCLAELSCCMQHSAIRVSVVQVEALTSHPDLVHWDSEVTVGSMQAPTLLVLLVLCLSCMCCGSCLSVNVCQSGFSAGCRRFAVRLAKGSVSGDNSCRGKNAQS